MNFKPLILGCALAFAMTEQSLANELRRMSDQEINASSDTILVGKVLSIEDRPLRGTETMKVAGIRVLAVVKGKVSEPVEIVLDYDAPESDFGRSVELGSSYVLFLIYDKKKRLRSTNGAYAARKLNLP